jgi:hypothetical protein
MTAVELLSPELIDLEKCHQGGCIKFLFEYALNFAIGQVSYFRSMILT